MKRIILILMFVVLVFPVFEIQASNDRPICKKTRAVVPDGFDDMLVYMGTGLVDQLSNAPGLENCAAGLCLDDYFHTQVMQLDASEISYQEGLAKQFYLHRFGIDVDVESASGRILFSQWTFDPRVEYRNYVAANKRVPTGGWVVRDGGWLVQIIDPAGFTLGGEFAGLHVGPGSQALFGNYNIAETGNNGKIKNKTIIYYRAGSFIETSSLLELHAICELSKSGPEFPVGTEGYALITAKFFFPTQTEIKFALRNVLTFGSSSPVNGLGPDYASGTCGQ